VTAPRDYGDGLVRGLPWALLIEAVAALLVVAWWAWR
jgi:hypothetical protein